MSEVGIVHGAKRNNVPPQIIGEKNGKFGQHRLGDAAKDHRVARVRFHGDEDLTTLQNHTMEIPMPGKLIMVAGCGGKIRDPHIFGRVGGKIKIHAQSRKAESARRYSARYFSTFDMSGSFRGSLSQESSGGTPPYGLRTRINSS